MKTKRLFALAVAFTLLMGGTAPSPFQRPDVQRDLDLLMRRGFTCRMLDKDVIELTDPLSGKRHLKTMREPTDATIRSWAAARDIPILEIDPNTIDTSRFRGWYTYWTTVPLGNGIGSSLVVGDLNHNEQADVYGGYLDSLNTDYETRLYEVDSTGQVSLRYRYSPRPGVSRQEADVDHDSIQEIVFSLAGIISGYEQHSRDSLPVHLAYTYDRFYHNSQAAGPNTDFIGNLDNDTLVDFLYQGTGPYPRDTNVAIPETYVAEYDPSLQNFVRVWSTQFYPNSGTHGFAVGDFDNNEKVDFVATHASGKVYVAEKRETTNTPRCGKTALHS